MTLPGDMALIAGDAPLAPRLRGGIVAIGNFDGVHRGHRAVIATARAVAAGRPVLVLTFEPHPRDYFHPDAPIYHLTPLAEKARVLSVVPVDGLVVQPFDTALADLEATRFVEEIVVAHLGAAGVVVGGDFRFGARRIGDAALLRALGAAHGFTAYFPLPERDGDGNIISSTRIRAALGKGDVARANDLLGYRHFAIGMVRPGDKRGRDLGYPTANVALPPSCRLRHGIYVVRVTLPDGVVRDGVASYGRRPTFDNGAPLLETHLFDFAGDLYGREIAVGLIDFLRPETKFEDPAALVRQMDRDAQDAHAVLARTAPLSRLDRALASAPVRLMSLNI